MKHLAMMASLVLLAACQSPSSAGGVAGKGDVCGAQSRQNLVGTPAADLDKSKLPPGTRVLHPNSVATMDYRADRLNILVNKEGKIESVHCG